MAFLAEVILPVYLKNVFHYLVKEEDAPLLHEGQRVLVPFGRTNKMYTGMVYKIYEYQEPMEGLKYIHQILDDIPILKRLSLDFWNWIAEYYCCALGEVMLFALPNHLIIHTQTKVSFTESIHSLDIHTLTEKEKKVVDFLANEVILPYDKLKERFSEYVIKKLIQKNILQLQSEIVNPYKPKYKTFVFLDWQNLQQQFDKNFSFHSSELIAKAVQYTKSEKQQRVLLYLLQNDGVEKQFLLHQLAITESVLKSLEKKFWIRTEQHAVDRVQLKTPSAISYELNLQEKSFCKKVIQKIENQVQWSPIVFYHDLGNNRISFYIEWFKHWVEKGQQVLFLVPEIAFTDKFVVELQNHFQDLLGIYHSKINDNERVEIWYKVFLKEYKIVIGVRSALFLPFSDLGIILVDEEQDAIYKQEEKNPKIHFRDAAIFYAKMLNLPIILVSQTPSIETFYFTQVKKYDLVKYLRNYPVHENQLLIKDLKTETTHRQTVGLFTEYAYKTLYEQKRKNHVSIVFINRKGYAPRIVCNVCGHVHYCKHCDIALTYHKQIHKLKCHYCGYQEDNIYFCKHCGSNDLAYEGLGTEKVEEQLHVLFPHFQITRLDSDNFKTKKQLSDFLQAVEHHQVDIVIGTQLVTKLLHLKNIELMVVLLADMMLHLPNFRALEYTYQFLKQLIYDLDLAHYPDKQLIIQTRNPNHKVFQYLFQEYEVYYHEQILLREELGYPPFSRLIEVEILHSHSNTLYQAIHTFDKIIRSAYSEYILGPSIPSIAKLKNYFRVSYLVKIPKNQNISKIKEHIQRSFKDFVTIEKDKNFRLNINVDPR